jgi:hypothetical protein
MTGYLALTGSELVCPFIALIALALINNLLLPKRSSRRARKSRKPEPQGVGWRRKRDSDSSRDEPDYRLRDDFLSRAELTFLGVLRVAVGDRAAVLCKVNLGDLFFSPRRWRERIDRNRINRKHVDFLLCDSGTMKPLCAIELDDSSHDREDRIARDAFVDGVFASAGLALLHVRVRQVYSAHELSALLSPHLPAAVAPTAPQASEPGQASRVMVREQPLDLSTPAGSPAQGVVRSPPMGEFVPISTSQPQAAATGVCPKCGVAMVERVASRGAKKGGRFLGCVNYPRCTHTAALPEKMG